MLEGNRVVIRKDKCGMNLFRRFGIFSSAAINSKNAAAVQNRRIFSLPADDKNSSTVIGVWDTPKTARIFPSRAAAEDSDGPARNDAFSFTQLGHYFAGLRATTSERMARDLQKVFSTGASRRSV